MCKCTISILSSLHLRDIERVLYTNSQSHQNFENLELEAIFGKNVLSIHKKFHSIPFSQRKHESRVNNARDLTKRSIDIKSIRLWYLQSYNQVPPTISPPIILRFRLQSSVRTLFVRARVATRVSTFYRSLRHAPRLKIIARKRRLRDTVLPSPSPSPLCTREDRNFMTGRRADEY